MGSHPHPHGPYEHTPGRTLAGDHVAQLDDHLRTAIETDIVDAAELLTRPTCLPGHRVYLHDDNDGVPAAICNIEQLDGRTAALWWLIVGRPLQRQGVASRLLEAALTDMPDVDLVVLSSDLDDTAGNNGEKRRALWARVGARQLNVTWPAIPNGTSTAHALEPDGPVSPDRLRDALHQLATFSRRNHPDALAQARSNIDAANLD